MREGDEHVVLRHDILIGGVDRRGDECGRPCHTSDSGGLDLAVERGCLDDHPQGSGTYRPSILTDQINRKGGVMTTDEHISRMKKAITLAIKVMGDRFGSTEQDVSRAIQELRASLQDTSEPSLSAKTKLEAGSRL